VPGFLLGICLMLLTAVMSWRRGYPIHPPTGFLGVLRSASRAGWAMGMPVLILVGVTGGIVTVTEAAALCVAYALLVGMLLHRDLKPAHIMPVLAQTALDTALVMIVVAMANGFGWLMAVSGLPRDAANLIASVSDDPMVILLLINALLLIVGCVMEAIAAMIILIPVLIPVVKAVGIDLTHFGVVMVFNLMLGLITPPVGLLLFINSNFAEIPVTATIRAVLPFLACALAVLLLITLVPDFVLLLPRMFGAV
jgi:C4-dicarboxylate transporter, DctM subunit